MKEEHRSMNNTDNTNKHELIKSGRRRRRRRRGQQERGRRNRRSEGEEVIIYSGITKIKEGRGTRNIGLDRDLSDYGRQKVDAGGRDKVEGEESERPREENHNGRSDSGITRGIMRISNNTMHKTYAGRPNK